MIKRFIAYLIDIVLVLIICSILNIFIPNNKVKELNHNMNKYNEQVLNHDISINEYVSDFMKLTYQIDKENLVYKALNIMVLIIYFIILPVILGGKTLGLKLLKLKINGNINIKNMIIRSIITVGIIYMILNILFIHILNYKYYFIIISILSFIQLLLVIISIFMIIYRRDKKGLQDILSNTYIEEVK